MSPDTPSDNVSFKALLLAAFLAAASSLQPSQSIMMFGIDKQTMVAKLNAAVEKALMEANYMHAIDLQTLQAFTIYLTTRCTEDITDSHRKLLGTLIRLAERGGLHRNSQYLQPSAVETQVRRLLWFQICILDSHIAQSLGSQMTILDVGLDTALPFNVDDIDLDLSSYQTTANNRWTDATFTLIRCEYHLLQRHCARQMAAIREGVADPTAARRLINLQRRKIEEKYLSNCDSRIPIQRCAKLLSCLLAASCDERLLYQHVALSAGLPLHRALQEAALSASLVVTRSAATLDTDPAFSSWTWHAGFYQQYHSAVPILMEVYQDPNIPRADKINDILDYVFGRFPGQNTQERNRDVLRLLMKKLNDISSLNQAQCTNVNLQPDFGLTISEEANMIPDMPDTSTPWQWSPMMDLTGVPGGCTSGTSIHDWTPAPSTYSMSECSQNSSGAMAWSSV